MTFSEVLDNSCLNYCFSYRNVDVEDGVTNGATGLMKYIDYRMEETNCPSVISASSDDP